MISCICAHCSDNDNITTQPIVIIIVLQSAIFLMINNGKKYWVNFSERFVCYSDNTLKEIIMVTGYSVNSLSHA